MKLSFLPCLLLFLSPTLPINSQDADVMPNAVSQMDVAKRGNSVFEEAKKRIGNIAAVEQVSVAQRYGQPIYEKPDFFSIFRFYGLLGFGMSIVTRQPELNAAIGSYLFPQPYTPATDCQDIAAHPVDVMLSDIARVGIFFNPFNNKSDQNIYGIIEFDFLGTSIATAYNMKLRHTFGEIVWNSGTLLFGQYFHPLFLPESFPRTVKTDMGASFEPQSLVPQLRLTQRFDCLEVIFALMSEAYLQTWGPPPPIVILPPIVPADITSSPGTPSLNFIQNAIVPNLHLQLKWRNNNSFVGAAIDYKRIVPRLVSDNAFKVNEHLDSIIAEAFVHKVFRWGEANFKIVYSENGASQLLTSGFAVRTNNPVTGFRTYSNLRAISGWLDIFNIFCNETMSLGLFFGGVKNLGSKDPLFLDPNNNNQPIVYGVNDISFYVGYTTRLSPRFVYACGGFRLGFELTWDALFGEQPEFLLNPVVLNKFAQVVVGKTVHSFSYEIILNYVF